MGSRQPMSDETMVLSESEDTDIGNVVSETDNSVDEGKAISAYNAYVLWTDTHPTWNARRLHKRRVFLEKLCTALVQPEM
ncbi:hypothetical protein T12_11315 [Trichinella patagoniensis]|uniref:PiggyBac transposable element-derived protein domain-containing protein n=1 Tax=Trichinella patagoniensis TaxID=990121 RepID=A0A0V0Z2K2_9BILA|nr:hypothetical protein T12_10389 [Trichinella patagoniensis]KRY07972.1 hypothetical protein T12_11315 [Trichinella patagoniensis]